MKRPETIRRATLQDLDALEQLEREVFLADAFRRSQLRYLLTRGHATIVVAQEAGQVLGAAIMLWRRGTTVGRLYSIATAPAAQGRGVGGRLLQACEEEASQRGCKAVGLEVRTDNRQARTFYERRGYGVIENLPGYYAEGADGLRLRKPLRPNVKDGR
jgi:ribosomal protein S18 acetylase RimI-like enzyme